MVPNKEIGLAPKVLNLGNGGKTEIGATLKQRPLVPATGTQLPAKQLGNMPAVGP